jgi:hypothetical protein
MRLSPRDQAMAFWLGMAGLAGLEQGHDHEALAYLERQLALKPGHARAAVHALSGNPDTARSRLDELRKALPHLSGEKLIEQYFGDLEDDQLPRLREGLRLALAAALGRRPAARLPSQFVSDVALASASPLTRLLVLPLAANRTIRARCRKRCCVFVERAKPSSSLRSAAVKIIAVASGMPLMHP